MIKLYYFEQNGSLWQFQQNLFDKYISNQEITSDEIKRLKQNLYIRFARYLAPSNLVIRHLCLIDMITGKYSNKAVIEEQIYILSYKWKKKVVGLWAEGYSYWQGDTKPFLLKWIEIGKQSGRNFEITERDIRQIDLNFQKTSYTREKVHYPAPFGDLFNVPLDSDLQVQQDALLREVKIYPIWVKNYPNQIITNRYIIFSEPIGFNLHTSCKEEAIEIRYGIPLDYKWYEGFDKKYKNSFQMIIAMLSIKRIISLFRYQ